MNTLNVCFIGLGSIAKRHIRNITGICKEQGIQLNVDVLRREHTDVSLETELGVRKVYYPHSEFTSKYDAVFITNPTELHMTTLEKYQGLANAFFIEKPISSISQIEQVEKFCPRKDIIYYVACPLRYNAVIQYIKNVIDINEIISVRSISSSYLPEWRPGIDYRDTYSAQRELGGGVSIDLIHEWDYLVYLFGFPKKISLLKGKKSNLEINSDDYAIYIAEYCNKIVELHLDYFGRKPIREIMLITKSDTIVGDLIKNEIVFLKSGKKIVFGEERDDYQIRELKHFLSLIGRVGKTENDIAQAVKILKLTQGGI